MLGPWFTFDFPFFFLLFIWHIESPIKSNIFQYNSAKSALRTMLHCTYVVLCVYVCVHSIYSLKIWNWIKSSRQIDKWDEMEISEREKNYENYIRELDLWKLLIQINRERTDCLVMVLGNLGYYIKKAKQDPYFIPIQRKIPAGSKI